MTGKQPNFFKYAHEMKYGIKGEDGAPRNRVGSGWENFFTEAVGFFLQADRQALERVCRELLRDRYESPEYVETQVRAEDGTPDIAIWLRSGNRCLIESKVDAPLGPGQPGKYLGSAQDSNGPFVALFSRRHHEVAKEVHDHPHYLRPGCNEHHYMWKHLYDWVRDEPRATEANRLQRYFCEYMEWLRLGWTITDRWRLLFEDRRVSENAAVRDAFLERLEGVRRKLQESGYRVKEADHYALIARPKPPKTRPFMHLVVKPSQCRKDYLEERLERYVGSAAMSVSLVYDVRDVPKHAKDLYWEFGREPFGTCRWVRLSPYKMTNSRCRLEFVADLAQFLSDDPHIMADRLVLGCSEILDRVSALMDKIG
jgi:hypothetical protein